MLKWASRQEPVASGRAGFLVPSAYTDR